jgi:hypothetical protein
MADVSINLNMKKQSGSGTFPPSGYTACQNNANYAYKYSGGNFDNGKGFEFTKESPPGAAKIVEIDLIGSGNVAYSVASAEIHYAVSPPAHADVSSSVSGNKITITDTDLDAESGTFNVKVNDTTNSVNGLQCDPRWQNK